MSVRLSATWILLAAVYTAAGTLGLSLAFINPSATAIWPPSGIALAAVLIFGPIAWPGIFLGALLTNELTAGTPATSVFIAAGNTLEALRRCHAAGRPAFTGD
jgi:integral membrane sensor domain MASE1